MIFSDFCKYYSDYQICHYTLGFKTSSFRYETVNNQLINLKFSVEEPGVYYFSLYQLKARLFPEAKKYCYSDCRLFISCVDNKTGDGNFIGALQEAKREAWFKAECVIGKTYYVQMFTPWKSFVNQITFTIYGRQEIKPTRLAKKDTDLAHMTDVIREKAYSNPEEGFNTWEENGHPEMVYKFEDTELGFGYFYFENSSEDTQLTVTINTKNSTGVVWGPPFDSDKVPTAIVSPGSFEAVYYTKHDKYSCFENFVIITTFTDVKKDNIEGMKKGGKKVQRL